MCMDVIDYLIICIDYIVSGYYLDTDLKWICMLLFLVKILMCVLQNLLESNNPFLQLSFVTQCSGCILDSPCLPVCLFVCLSFPRCRLVEQNTFSALLLQFQNVHALFQMWVVGWGYKSLRWSDLVWQLQVLTLLWCCDCFRMRKPGSYKPSRSVWFASERNAHLHRPFTRSVTMAGCHSYILVHQVLNLFDTGIIKMFMVFLVNIFRFWDTILWKRLVFSFKILYF